MPTYDYHCKENDQIVEVKHPINEKLTNWGEVCSHTGMDLGNTSADSPVARLISGGQVVKSSTLKNPEPACAPGGCCSGGMCGM
ncbi:zinc ribbon domain-containing protein [Candidatus Parabeggiatoa sp. HSG14]|uniref:zinc ribbon domain-containing protein n=1 Tax=Candidatus Parabeggiatoa sp. HSG14 TaxID=3055593 RepID=UPI0025A6D20B|nr:zinc ribbon domain-containing protein [Thiotrichales bacterium HSG14]